MEHVHEEEGEYRVIPQHFDTNALATYIKAEIDMQIATAKAYPRSIKTFLNKVESMATATPTVAESCTYALPRKEKKDGKWETKFIKGPSVRLAEIVAASYGNLRAGARVVNNDGRFITAQGICHDLETNSMVTIEVKRKITGKDGKPFSEDMQVVTGNAACKIAYRNAVFTTIPAALMIEVYEKIQEVAKGTASTLLQRRDKAINFFKAKGVKDEQLCEVLEVKAIEDIDLDKLEILTGFKMALMNEETTIDQLFPVHEHKDKANKAVDATLGSIKEITTKAAQNKGDKK
jgi:hypothetical protein